MIKITIFNQDISQTEGYLISDIVPRRHDQLWIGTKMLIVVNVQYNLEGEGYPFRDDGYAIDSIEVICKEEKP